MPKAYEPAPPEVKNRAKALIERHHGLDDLWKSEAAIDYVFATNDSGDAVSHRGYPALAVVKILDLKQRTMGRGDAEITIDAAAYLRMSDRQKDALLHHELHHLIIMRDDDGLVKSDDQGRPRMKMRKHDYDFGWFTDIAMLYGMDSPEVTQAKMIWDHDNQSLFPFLEAHVIEADELPLSRQGVDTVTFSAPGMESVTVGADALSNGGKALAEAVGKISKRGGKK